MDKIDNQFLITGDAIEKLQELPDKSIDLVVTDPPYNLNKNYGKSQDRLEFDEYIEFSKNWI